MSSAFCSRSSISKQRGAEMSSRLMPPKQGEIALTIVKAISPCFGGINLEDISAPRCFEIEERLQKALDIPVFHDDQHGTAVVVLAGILHALKVVKKKV